MQDPTEENKNQDSQQPIQPTTTTEVGYTSNPAPSSTSMGQSSSMYTASPSPTEPNLTNPTSPSLGEVPISSAGEPASAGGGINTTDSAPFVPDGAPKKSKKKLILGIVAAVVAVFAIGGGSAFAAYYMNPEKVVSDAIVNEITARSQISNGSFIYTDGKNKGKISLTFDSKSDTPNFKGQLNAKLAVDYEKYDFEIAGGGMLSDTGNAYFKFDGVEKAINKYINEPEIKVYTDKSPKLKNSLIAFAKKIDGKYIKLSKTDIQDFWKNYDHSKAKACYSKVFEDLDKNSIQKKQIYDAYEENKFVKIKDQGSENINGVDSVKYGVGIDMVQYNRASNALEETIFAQNMQRCQDELTGEKTLQEDLTAEEKKEKQKREDEDSKEEQKEADKAKVNLWISRWGHQFSKASASYENDEEKTKYLLNINYRQDQKISVADPKESIPLSEFRADIEKIQNEYYSAYSGGQSSSLTASSNSQNLTYARSIQKKAEAYAADNYGTYPTLQQLKEDQGVAKLSSETLAVISDQAPSSANQSHIQYKSCENGTGYSVYYWDTSANAISEDLGFGC